MKFLARKDKKDANTQTYIAIEDLEVSRPQGREGRLFDLVILSLFLHSGGSVHEMTQAFIERGPGIAEALFIYPLLLNKKRDVLSAHALEGIVEQRLEDAMNAYQEDLTAIELDLPLSHFRRKVLEGGEVAVGESLVEFWDGMFDADRARHAEQQLGIKKIALVPMLVEGEPYGVVVFAFDKTDIDAEIVELLVGHFTLALRDISAQEDTARFNDVDPVTWVYNKRYVTEAVEAELIRCGRYGKALVAIREDARRTEMLGYDIRFRQWATFVLAAVLAGLSGLLYVQWGNYITPSQVGLLQAALPVIWVAVGGRDKLLAVVIATYALNWLNYTLSSQGNQYALVIIGALLVIVMLFFPRGIIVSIADLLGRRRARPTPGAVPASAGE